MAQPATAAVLQDCDATAIARPLHPGAGSSPIPAEAIWLDGFRLRWPGVSGDGEVRLYHSAGSRIQAEPGDAVDGADGYLRLEVAIQPLPREIVEAFRYFGEGSEWQLAAADRDRIAERHREQLLLVQVDESARVLARTRIQHGAALDALFADQAHSQTLGVSLGTTSTDFRIWAPTAQSIAVCFYPDARGPAEALTPMRREADSGIWKQRMPRHLSGRYYNYLIDIFVPGTGWVRNRVSDPYAISLNANGGRAYIGELDSPELRPRGWNATRLPAPGATDRVIYELHVRDFSSNDSGVPYPDRGRYLAFTHAGSHGMRHLRALAAAGITDVHLLPVFDFATVPEDGCVTPHPSGDAGAVTQQAVVTANQASDCFNWGYDPLHFNAPEGSYSSNADDGARRIIEFRQMVQSLHQLGLRVGMDVVYNHTSAAGQQAHSVLDRIVPGYYQRYDRQGRVETSTCCANTATERRMMAKLMIDSVVLWARDHHIDSFRFDLMGHQPRAAMEALQKALRAAVDQDVLLLGEGWNFGEVADGARFVQAAQGQLDGTGIATFSDRARDAIRGGGPADHGVDLLRNQGYINGLHYAPNARTVGVHARSQWMQAADLVRVGLAGSLRDYRMQDYLGQVRRLADIVYAGSLPAGYVGAPDEVVNYVENHDNQTLFDINAYKLPPDTTRADRARVQILGAAINVFSQGIGYFHAGIEILRSKSLDRNSYDSGDWFNRIDWTMQDNHFGSGLPPRRDNEDDWDLMRPLLSDSAIKPTPENIAWARAVFLDLLRIRASSSLFRLRSAQAVQERLQFLNTGPEQDPGVLVGRLDGRDLAGAGFERLMYVINVEPRHKTLTLPTERGVGYVLHPIQRAVDAGDQAVRTQARWDRATARVQVPARSAAVFVVEPGVTSAASAPSLRDPSP